MLTSAWQPICRCMLFVNKNHTCWQNSIHQQMGCHETTGELATPPPSLLQIWAYCIRTPSARKSQVYSRSPETMSLQIGLSVWVTPLQLSLNLSTEGEFYVNSDLREFISSTVSFAIWKGWPIYLVTEMDTVCMEGVPRKYSSVSLRARQLMQANNGDFTAVNSGCSTLSS